MHDFVTNFVKKFLVLQWKFQIARMESCSLREWGIHAGMERVDQIIRVTNYSVRFDKLSPQCSYFGVWKTPLEKRGSNR